MPRVELRFDGVSRGAETSAARTRGAIKSVGDQADREDRRVNRFGGTIANALGVAAGAAARGAVLGVGAVGGAVAFAGFKFDDLKQRAQIAFETMLGSGQKASAFLRDLQKFAAATPFEFPDLIRTSQTLLAMGFASKDILPTLTAVGDATAALGGSPETMAMITRALGQMQAKGKTSAEEMLQLTEAGVPAWQMLADKIGTSVPQAMALVQKRAIDAKTTIAAVTEGMERRFGGMMEKQSHTFGGLLSTVKDTFNQLAGTVMAPFFEASTRGLQRIVDLTSGPGFTAGIQRFGQVLDRQVRPAVVTVLSAIVAGFRALIPPVLEVARSILRYWQAIGPPILMLFRGIYAAVAPLIASLARIIRDTFDALAREVNKHRAEIDRIVLRISQALGLISRVLQAVVLPVIRFVFVEVLPRAIGFAITAIDKLTGAIATIAGFFRRTWRAASALTSAFFNWIVKTALVTALKVVEPFSHLPGGMGGWARRAKNRIQGELDGITIAAGKTGSEAGRAWGEAFMAQLRTFDPATKLFPGTTTATGAPPKGLRGRGVTYSGQATTHPTAGLPGYPAVDIMGTPGTPVLAPEAGSVIRHSGRPPSQAPPMGQGGPWGLSLYFAGDSGTTYYMTHLQWVAPLGGYRKGAVIGQIGDYPGSSADHVHIGVHRGGKAGVQPPATPAPTVTPISTTTPTTTSTKPKGPARADPAEVQAAERTTGYIEQHLARVLSPTLRKNLRKRVDLIQAELGRVHTEKDLRDVQARLKKLVKAFEDAVALGNATRIARSSAASIAMAINRLPADMARDLRPRMERVRRELANVTSAGQLARIRTELTKIQDAVRAAIEKLQTIVSQRRDAFGAAFGRVADKALEVFDAQTEKLLSRARARVAGFNFEIGVGEETPAERLLRQRTEARQAEEISARITAAQNDLNEAYLAGDPAEVAAKQKALQDALYDAETAGIDDRAKAERAAADASLALEQKRITDERALLRERFGDRIQAIQTALANEQITAKEARDQLLALMADPQFQTDFASVGELLGASFAAGFTDALEALTATLNALIDAINKLNVASGTPPIARVATPGPVRRRPRFAGGGTVPGQYLGRADTIVGALTPGEEVVDRSTSAALRAYLARGGGGRTLDGAKIYVLGTTEREVAAALARLIDPESERGISYGGVSSASGPTFGRTGEPDSSGSF